ncbi:hypothetical protein Slin15195_G075340 [Septoria linicola]|uniref:Chromatin modification-related protein EAF6 n=1 Tax=Septoria linicola TaxID=215465 RepID=A0A9Q9ASC2_9PEZI|nr:hypothetical protein Slin14017_G036430 [Septoria linicola]USW54215.1 hypothetical protein Slin15195_G075340 [Septoria linicola]
MAENVPPNAAQSSSTAADQPGRPYYESLRTTLRQTLEKKRKLDEQLALLEDNIYKTEGAYLEETANSGNIVRGFDGWVKGVQIGNRSAVDGSRRGGRVREEDRVFSRSSVSWMRQQEGIDSGTPSHAPTPTGNFPSQLSARESNASTPAAGAGKTQGNKKKRATDKDEDEDLKPSKRHKISYARD